MKKSWLVFLFLALVFPSFEVSAQCADNLNQAKQAFDEGHLYGIPALLADCVNKGTKQDKKEAYELLTLTYLYIDDPLAAEQNFMKLLELDPEYRVDSTTHIELVHLSKEYITTPIVSWRARGGVNVSTVTSIYNNGSNNSTLETGKYALSSGGSLIGSFDIHISKLVSFSLESDLNYNTYIFTNSFFDLNGEQNFKDDLELKEKSISYSLPISVKLTYPGNKYYPYVYAGYSPNYNFITTSDAVYKGHSDIGKETSIETKDDNLDISPIRNRFSNSVILGIGLKRRINLNYVFVDVRYKMGLSNRLNRSAQYDFDKEDINKYALTYLQQDNDFRQNELNITFGYIWPKYKARKRKSVTAGSFIKGMFKKKKKDE